MIRLGFRVAATADGSSPTAWSSSSGSCSEEALHPWRVGVGGVRSKSCSP